MLKRILLLLFIGVNTCLYAQEFATRLYTPKDGLVQAQVYCVTQGPQGYLWIGTLGGISRFDGIGFKNFTDADGISSYAVYHMQWYNDTLFVLTKEGVDIIVDNKVYSYFYDSTINFMMGRIKIMPEHRYAIGHNYDYYFYLDLKTKKVTRFPEKLQLYGDMHVAMTDSSFLIAKDDFVYEMQYGDTTYKKRYKLNNPLGIKIHDSTVYFNCKKEVVRIDNKGTSIIMESDSLYVVFVDGDGTIFYSNGQGDLSFKQNNNLIKLSGNYNYILKFFEDKDGIIWVSTEKGLLKIYTDKFKYYNSNQGYVDNVWAVAGFNDSLILMSSYTKGIHLYENGKEKSFGGETGQYRACYFGICKGFRNDFLIPVYPGVARYDIDKNRLSTITKNLEDNNYTLIKDTANNRVLVASLHSVVAIYPDYSTEKLFDLTSIGNYQFVTSLTVRNNKILIGLSRGLMELNPDTKDIKYLSHDRIRYVSLVTDKHNTVWAATSRGLLKIVGDSLTFLVPNNSNQDFTAVYLDNDMLYAASSTKLYLLDLKKYYNGEKDFMKYYGIYDGYDGDSPQQDAFYKDESGNLWFPTGYHVIKMDINELNKPLKKLTAFITSMSVSKGDTSLAQVDINKKIKVNFNQNNVVINFASINLINPERTQYQTVLNSRKRQWKSVSKSRTVSFNNLPLGKYTFTVKASVSGNFDTAKAAVLNFTILPPFWQKAWFITLAVVLFLIIMILLLRYVKKREQKKTRGKMEILQLKNQALTTQMDNHFIVNCTSKIVVLYEQGKTEEAAKYTRLFSRFLQQNLEFMRRDKISLSEEIQLVKNYVYLEMIHKNDFTFEVNIDKTVDVKAFKIPPLLIQPVIENAVKYGIKKQNTENGKITLSATLENSGLLIKIKDNGPGFQKQATSKTGNRVSLKIINERLQLIDKSASFDIKSNGNGTTVKIYIPQKKKND